VIKEVAQRLSKSQKDMKLYESPSGSSSDVAREEDVRQPGLYSRSPITGWRAHRECSHPIFVVSAPRAGPRISSSSESTVKSSVRPPSIPPGDPKWLPLAERRVKQETVMKLRLLS